MAIFKNRPHKVVLTAEQSLQLQSALHLSHSGVRELRRQAKEVDLPFKIASKSKMQEERAKYHVDSAYYEGVLLDGSKGKVISLVFAANVADIVARDTDRLVATDTYFEWKFKCNEGRANGTI